MFFKNKETGEKEKEKLKCISKSHPLFEEFRLWQFLKNVRISNINTDEDVTHIYLPNEDSYVDLFNKLKEKKEIKQSTFFSSFKGMKLKDSEFKWNYGERVLPLCPVHADFVTRLKKAGIKEGFLSLPLEEQLWHILYSVNDKYELAKALKTFAEKQHLPDVQAFVDQFIKIKPFDNEYASYSAKAIKKLLPLMRMGKYWNEKEIEPKTLARINKLINGEEDEHIGLLIREKINKELGNELSVFSFKGLPLWLACYVVYGRHSEASAVNKWTSPEDITQFLAGFKQHSLRNPIVEQVVTETLRVVRNIWEVYGDLSEIHIELAREMKNPAEKRKELTALNLKNENTNIRIRALLKELKNSNPPARPESLSHLERLKLFEEGVLGSADEIPEDISKIINKKQEPTHAEILRYKCWLDQGYRSPYTGNPISLSKLFSEEYNVEHIIPKARYYDDSFSNKIICEAAINADKGDMLACEYIKNHKVGEYKYALLSFNEYESLVQRVFKNSPIKKKKLLMEEIPDSFIERQLNDTRYISRYIKGLLSNIVREENEQEATSKNILPVTGGITAKLKEDWGLNSVWNKIVAPRFIRLNELTQSDSFGYWKNKYTFKTLIPEENQRGFSKKRIDHRHHALDALVIACTTRLQVNYLNSKSAKPIDENKEEQDPRHYIRAKLCYKDKNNNWLFNKPWNTFTQDSHSALDQVIISFKQNLRILTKTSNKYLKYNDGVKETKLQTKGDNRAIRKPLHKETVYGRVNLQLKKTVSLSTALNNWQKIADREIKEKIKQLFEIEKLNKKQVLEYFKKLGNSYNEKNISKVEIFYYSEEEKEPMVAVRKSLDEKFSLKNIESVTDSGIQKILLRHLEKYGGKTTEAFSPEGIEDMNRNITALNGGKFHKPVYKVRVSEILGNKFPVGEKGNKKEKYVEAEKGTNLFFAVYQNENGERLFETIPLNVIIENLKNGEDKVPLIKSKNDREYNLLFTLSPNDLVYIPTEDQLERKMVDLEDIENNKERIYKFISCTANEAHFIPSNIAKNIIDTTELGSNNKSQRTWNGNMIKETCIKLKITRLGSLEKITAAPLIKLVKLYEKANHN